MRRLEGPAGLHRGLFRNPVATVGTFDGLHRGHRAVLDETARLARERDGEPVVVTFDIHPRAVVTGRAPGLLLAPELRQRLFEEAGVAATVILHFDEELRSMEARRFLDDLLGERIGIGGLVLGHDSRFGRDRAGDEALARSVLGPRGIPVVTVPPVLLEGAPVSSTSLREAVAAGDLRRAAALAGRPWSTLGTVVRGDGRGRTLGWPTANLDLGGVVRPPRGVWIGEARLEGGARHRCLVNIGGRPTFHPEGDAVETVEVWLDGFQGDLYGSRLVLSFLSRLRGEERFDGPDALRAQIALDRVAMIEFHRRESQGAAVPGAASCSDPAGEEDPGPRRVVSGNGRSEGQE